MRGIRGAITVKTNSSAEIIEKARRLIVEIGAQNKLKPENVVHVLFSMTEDLDAEFPAKALRLLDGWTYVPVMCTREISVPGSLPKCIRVMVTVQSDMEQQDIQHIYLDGAEMLRPDLQKP